MADLPGGASYPGTGLARAGLSGFRDHPLCDHRMIGGTYSVGDFVSGVCVCENSLTSAYVLECSVRYSSREVYLSYLHERLSMNQT